MQSMQEKAQLQEHAAAGNISSDQARQQLNNRTQFCEQQILIVRRQMYALQEQQQQQMHQQTHMQHKHTHPNQDSPSTHAHTPSFVQVCVCVCGLGYFS